MTVSPDLREALARVVSDQRRDADLVVNDILAVLEEYGRAAYYDDTDEVANEAHPDALRTAIGDAIEAHIVEWYGDGAMHKVTRFLVDDEVDVVMTVLRDPANLRVILDATGTYGQMSTVFDMVGPSLNSDGPGCLLSAPFTEGDDIYVVLVRPRAEANDGE